MSVLPYAMRIAWMFDRYDFPYRTGTIKLTDDSTITASRAWWFRIERIIS